MKTNNLVQSWLHVELEINGKRLVDALAEMNEELGTSYTHSRIREFEELRGQRGVRLQRETRLYMTKVIFRTVLERYGIDLSELSERSIVRLCNQIC